MALLGRFVWLVQNNELSFESDITALLPISKESWLVKNAYDRIASEFNNQIAIIVHGQNMAQTDAATDRLTDLLEQAISQHKIQAKQPDQLEFDLLSARIEAMLAYKNRLLSDRSRQRIQDPNDSQLIWRMEQVTRFPPSNITDPVADPLGTLNEFLTERMPNFQGVQSDGLYLRVIHDTPANLIFLKLTKNEFGVGLPSNSVRWIIEAKDTVVREFNVNLYLSGVPLHASAIKEQTIKEIHWMVSLAVAFTVGFFLYIIGSIRALLISVATILLAIISGLVISYETIGLPHLIGLTMATTAIGICIDFSFHFWIHVRSGMSGVMAVRTIFTGLNMSLLTTTIGLLVIIFTAIPVLVRSAVFICGVLLVSWSLIVFLVPHFAGKPGAGKPMRRSTLSRQFAISFVLAITIVSAIGLGFKYYTDDSPARLGQQAEHLLQDDLVVQDLLGVAGQPSIYLMKANSAESLIEAETNLLNPLTDSELSQVQAVSRLVVSHAQQRYNQLLFKQAMSELDSAILKQYLETLQVPDLDWESDGNRQYNLNWVVAQPWASLERNSILTCGRSVCASMIRARGAATDKLDASCQRTPECSRVSLLQNQLDGFQELRVNLMWTLLLAISAVFLVLYLRYRNKAFLLIAVPVLASVSGIAAVAWAGMPVTVFSLAAVFPLLGLSIDYVVFASEAKHHSSPTFSAIFASALTTSVSFWLLCFSTTPAVQFFALPIAVGIPVAWVFVQIMPSAHA